MKLLFSRALLGGSAVLFGVIALLWRDAETWQSVYPLWTMPLGHIIGPVVMIALIVAGVAFVVRGAWRWSAIGLAAVLGVFCLVCLPNIVAHPTRDVGYLQFSEMLCPACGALAALYARASRIGLGLCALSFAIAQAVYWKFTATLVPIWIPPGQVFWTVLTTIAFALAALSILSNQYWRAGARMMALMVALFGVLIWIPAVVLRPMSHNNWSELAINFLIAGGTWIIAETVETAKI